MPIRSTPFKDRLEPLRQDGRQPLFSGCGLRRKFDEALDVHEAKIECGLRVPTVKTRLVSFDAAGTLIDVRWTLDGFARDCMSRLGVVLPEEAYARLLGLYGESLPGYLQVNLTRDPEQGEAFWCDLTRRWLVEFGVEPKWVRPSREVAKELMLSPESGYFRLYPDVLPCLDRLRAMGLRLAIVSNWDYTLHPIVRALGIEDRFDPVIASLEEGVEKPDPRLFEICLSRTDTASSQALHVGDDITDDVEGALAAWLRPVLIKRVSPRSGAEAEFVPKSFAFRCEEDGRTQTFGAVITSLSELPEVVRSIG